jgi:hypothetical protein
MKSKGNKREEASEMKVHFVIFCNCAQFLMKARFIVVFSDTMKWHMNAEIYDEKLNLPDFSFHTIPVGAPF